jgi:hypothetical protein
MVHYEYPAADWFVGAQLRPAAEVPVQVTDYALMGGAAGGLDLNQQWSSRGRNRQAQLRGTLPVVVDMDYVAASAIKQGRADGGTEAASAVHPYLPLRHFASPGLDFPERDVHGSGYVACLPFVRTAYIDCHDPVLPPPGGQGGEV